MEFFRLLERGFKALALLRQHMDDNRMIALLGKFQRADQQRQVVAVNRAEITEAHFLKEHRAAMTAPAIGFHLADILLQAHAGQRALEAFLGLVRKLEGDVTLGQATDEIFKIPGQLVVAGIGDELVKVVGDGSDVLRDAPFIVIQNANELLGGGLEVVKRLKGNAIGQGRIAENANDVLIAAALVTGGRHAQRGGKGRAGVTSAKAIVFALRAERKTVQTVRLADGAEPVAAPGEQLVNVNLVADVPDKFVLGRIEDAMEGDGEFHHAQIGSEMAAAFGETINQLGPDFAGELLQLGHRELFNLLRPVHHVQVSTHILFFRQVKRLKFNFA